MVHDAVTFIQDIRGAVETAGVIATKVASAVDAQQSATAEISRNVQDMAIATQDVTLTIGGSSRSPASPAWPRAAS